tara:strand:- start:1303 stop:2433 length:1131 start_codon:yes stop_codon:yes gene_type:complete
MTTAINQRSAVRVHDLIEVLDALLEENQNPGNRLTIYLPSAEPDQLSSLLSSARKTARESVHHAQNANAKASDAIMQQVNAVFEDEDDFVPYHCAAVFIEPEQTRVFRLGANFSPASFYSHRWHLTPMMDLAANVHAFNVLLLSQNAVRLFRGSRLGIRDISTPKMPKSFDESKVASLRAGGDDPKAERQSSPDKELMARFFQEIDREVVAATAGLQGPLILAGAAFYLPIYEEITKHPKFSGKILEGNHEHSSPVQLQELAMEALHHELIESRKAQLLHLHQLDGQGKLESNPDHALLAAHQGRIKSLVVPSDVVRWGRFDSQGGTVEETDPHDFLGSDLHQLTAEFALQNGAELFYLRHSKMPSSHPLAAALRY